LTIRIRDKPITNQSEAVRSVYIYTVYSVNTVQQKLVPVLTTFGEINFCTVCEVSRHDKIKGMKEKFTYMKSQNLRVLQ